MRIDNAQFTGSATGTQATANLTGSFTGSGHIDKATTASKLEFSASFGLGIGNTFNFDGSSNQVVTIDTASAHFIGGVESASIDNAETGSFIVSMSAASASSGQLLLEKGDGTFLSQSITATNVVNSLNGGSGIEAFSYNGSTTQTVTIATGSARFIEGVVKHTGSLVRNIGIAGTDTNMVVTYGDGTTATIPVVSSSFATTASLAITASYFAGDIAGGSTLDNTVTISGSTISGSVISGSNIEGGTINNTVIEGGTINNATLTNITASSIQATGSFKGDLTGTASFASKVENALSQGTGVDTFTYDGSATATVSIATYSGSTATSLNLVSGSASTLRDTIVANVSGAFTAPSSSIASDIVDLTSSIDYISASAAATSDTIVANVSGAFTAPSASIASDIVDLTSSIDYISASAAATSDAIVANVSGAFTAPSASIAADIVDLTSSIGYVSASQATDFAALSASAIVSVVTTSLNEEDSLTFTRGDGTTFTTQFYTGSLVKSVNTITPGANGNVAVALASVETGTSASMLAASSSATLNDGDVWVISGETGPGEFGSASNGVTYIFASQSGQLLEIASLTEVAADSKYVNVSGDAMTGNLTLPADPTLAAEAARKNYVDLFYDSSSIAGSDVSLYKGNGTIDILSITEAVSASHLSQTDGKRIVSTTGPAENYIELKQGAGDLELAARDNIIVNVDTNDGGIGTFQFQVNGATSASIDQDGTGSFNWVDSTSSYAQKTVETLSNGTLVDTFTFDGSAAATVDITNYSASAATHVASVSSSLTTTIAAESASAATALTTYSSSTAATLVAQSSSQATSVTNLSSSVSAIYVTAGSTTNNLSISASSLTGSTISGSTYVGGDYTGGTYNYTGGTYGYTGGTYNYQAGSTTNYSGGDYNYTGGDYDYTGGTYDYNGVAVTYTGATITGDTFNITGSLQGTASYAASASGLTPGATIATTGEVTGTATNFDGTGAISIPTTIANDVIDYATLGAEFTSVDTAGGATIDFDIAAVFTRTLTANTAFTFSNAKIGDVKTIVVDCQGFTPSIATATFTLVGSGVFDTTSGKTNVISILCTDGTNFVGTILTD